MVMTDPIADMLTRVRNANSVYHEKVTIPASRVKTAIAEILKEEGYIKDYALVTENNHPAIEVTLKYAADKERVIHGIKRISTPGLRIYAQTDELPKVLGGLGIALISTSQGIMTDRKARKANLGGEVIAYVW